MNGQLRLFGICAFSMIFSAPYQVAADPSCKPADYGFVIGGEADQNVSAGPNFRPAAAGSSAQLSSATLLSALAKGTVTVSAPGTLLIAEQLNISRAKGSLMIDAKGDLIVSGAVVISVPLALKLSGNRIDQTDCEVRPGNGRSIEGGSLALRADQGIGTQLNGDQAHLNIKNVTRLAATSDKGDIRIITFTKPRLRIDQVADLKGIQLDAGSLHLRNQEGAITIHGPVNVSGRATILPTP